MELQKNGNIYEKLTETIKDPNASVPSKIGAVGIAAITAILAIGSLAIMKMAGEK